MTNSWPPPRVHWREGEVGPGARGAEGADRAGKRPPAGPAGRQRPRCDGSATPEVRADVTLVDTSVWIDHWHASDRTLARLLNERSVLGHPFVVGEVAMGSLRGRDQVLTDMRRLPQAAVARHDEVLGFIERHRLFGLGMGYVDAHLIAATRTHARRSAVDARQAAARRCWPIGSRDGGATLKQEQGGSRAGHIARPA